MNNTKNILESNGVKFTPVNFGELKVTFPTLNYEIKKQKQSNRFVEEIKYGDEIIRVGDNYNCVIPTGDSQLVIDYKVNHIGINPKDNTSFSLLESILNNTTIFILPFIFKNRQSSSIIEFRNEQYIGYLMNAYVESTFLEKKDPYSVFLLMKYTKSERYKKQEALFKENECFVRNIDIDFKYVIYEFIIPDKYKRDFDLLLNGKYSEIRDSSKKRITDFHGDAIEGTIAHNILTRNQQLIEYYEKELDVSMKGIELASKFGELEVLTKNML